MRFVTEDNQIKCIRTQLAADGESTHSVEITSFDENQQQIPPHAAACLSEFEIKRLEAWLAERASLKQKLEQEPVERTILDTLPDMMLQAKQALARIDQVDIELFKRLKKSIRELDEHLDSYHVIVDSPDESIDYLQKTEVLKEKLSNIKASL
ncbi:hypothetical protein FLL45_05495 [Aliikangiella marina]|uniref:Uncharacterized protein n=1 Tax=Aliikangiella marina TaxID=1712262 RepID=A0A545TJJ3_9GAMM|nr:hypothetical protein [Aliikangiella marina]TQV77399.1 hypothetical protein FLL45_05495 [Aliikangiella marina]